jgi:hypothetical protein
MKVRFGSRCHWFYPMGFRFCRSLRINTFETQRKEEAEKTSVRSCARDPQRARLLARCSGYLGGEFLGYPAFSIAGSEMSRRSTISLVTSNSFTRFWLGR